MSNENRPQRFVTKLLAVDAMQIPREDQAIQPFTAFMPAHIKVRISPLGKFYFSTTDGELAALPGDWVVKHGDYFRIVRKEHFDLQFETAPTLVVPLSFREKQVLICISRGMKATAIAEALGISAKTVGTYRDRVLAKLGVKSNVEAALLAHHYVY